jgi:hypothetical protein
MGWIRVIKKPFIKSVSIDKRKVKYHSVIDQWCFNKNVFGGTPQLYGRVPRKKGGKHVLAGLAPSSQTGESPWPAKPAGK